MAIKINRTWVVMGIAITLGLTAALIASRHLNQRVADIEAKDKNREMVKVVVAKEDLPKGEKLTIESVAVREMPREWAHSNAITPDQFSRAENGPLAVPARRGEPIVWSQLDNTKARSFSATLSPGHRAITVPVDEINSISGMLDPGDLIDIVVTLRHEGKTYAFTLLQSVQVLAAGTRITQSGQNAEGKQTTYNTVTLNTDPENAKRVIAAREIGKITALLRAPGDQAQISDGRSEAYSLLGFEEKVKVRPAVDASIPVIYGGSGNRLGEIPKLASAVDSKPAP
jgi:pilus assembly protein CpaB